MKTFLVCQASANPPPRRPIINMFTKVSMGAKFSEFMRIEKRSSVCVIYQWTNTNKYGCGIRKIFPCYEREGWWVMSQCHMYRPSS